MSDSPRAISLASVGRSAAILTGATMVVQLVGIVRELFLAATVGVSPRLDALIIGIALPTMLAGVFTAGTQTALVPAYMGTRDGTGLADARRVAGTVLVWVAILGALASVLMALLAEPLVALTGPGLEPADAEAAALYLRITSPVAFFTGIIAVLLAVCQAEKMFREMALASILSPAVALAVMFALWDQLDLDAVAVGALVGPIIEVAILLVITLRRGVGPRLRLVAAGLGLGQLARHAVPLTVSAAILQLNIILDRAIATIIAPGGVSLLRFGDSLLRAPIGAIRPAWSNALYPSLVQSAGREGAEGLGPATDMAYRYTIAVFVPLAVLTAAVAPVLTAVVYGRGEFDAEDIAGVSRVLLVFAPLIFLLTIDAVTTPAMNARRRGTVLLIAGIFNVVLNLVFDVLFGLAIGIVGIALSSTVTAVIVTAWKMIRFARDEEGIALGGVSHAFVLALIASLPAGIVIGLIGWNVDLGGDALLGLAFLALAGILEAAGFVLASRLVGFREPLVVTAWVTGWLSRR